MINSATFVKTFRSHFVMKGEAGQTCRVFPGQNDCRMARIASRNRKVVEVVDVYANCQSSLLPLSLLLLLIHCFTRPFVALQRPSEKIQIIMTKTPIQLTFYCSILSFNILYIYGVDSYIECDVNLKK